MSLIQDDLQEAEPMLLTNTINAVTTIETILAGNACVCANELRCDSANSVQFADWRPVQRKAKHFHRLMRASGYPGSESMPTGGSSLPGPIAQRGLRSVAGHAAVS